MHAIKILGHSLWLCLGAVTFYLSAQVQFPGQAALDQRPAGSQTLLKTSNPQLNSSYLPLPTLPAIRPVLPEVNSHAVRLVLKLRERQVYVYQDNELKTSYPVAVGKPGWETPTGNFQVIQMVQNPGWTNPFTGEVVSPGPESPLGARWIAFWTDGTDYVGFHGTPNQDSVGRAASHGCVRMFNQHVRELYELVDLGTVVEVEP